MQLQNCDNFCFNQLNSNVMTLGDVVVAVVVVVVVVAVAVAVAVAVVVAVVVVVVDPPLQYCYDTDLVGVLYAEMLGSQYRS